MPSLHFGWDLLLGLGVIWAFWPETRVRTVSTRALFWIALAVGITLPVLQIFSITLTANHFLLDAAAGGVVALMGVGVALVLQRWGYPALKRWAQPVPGVRRLVAPDNAVPVVRGR
jgi:peptidoglycan/LPS O-acetylase OafA/YrhL